MKQLTLALTILCAVCASLRAGTLTSGKETQPAPCPEWYGDNEWNVSVWGAFAFTGTEYAPNRDLVDLIVSTTEGQTVLGTFDRYLGNDHAWGGGIDVKYFFHRYFGVGIQGFLLNARRDSFNIDVRPDDSVFILENTSEHRVIGSVLGTLTLRYPMPCSRFSPYAWAGLGTIWGGGESERLTTEEIEDGDGGAAEPPDEEIPFVNAHTHHFGDKAKLMGQFGGGLEVRITRHIGWMTDFSWNAISGARNDFGMFRTGINFAF